MPSIATCVAARFITAPIPVTSKKRARCSRRRYESIPGMPWPGLASRTSISIRSGTSAANPNCWKKPMKPAVKPCSWHLTWPSHMAPVGWRCGPPNALMRRKPNSRKRWRSIPVHSNLSTSMPRWHAARTTSSRPRSCSNRRLQSGPRTTRRSHWRPTCTMRSATISRARGCRAKR